MLHSEIRKEYFILLTHKGYELFTNEKSYGFFDTFDQAMNEASKI